MSGGRFFGTMAQFMMNGIPKNHLEGEREWGMLHARWAPDAVINGVITPITGRT